jgi:hypothetical protein
MIDIVGWLFAAILLVGLVSLVVVFQDRLIYFPPRYSPAQLEDARARGAQELRFQHPRVTKRPSSGKMRI